MCGSSHLPWDVLTQSCTTWQRGLCASLGLVWMTNTLRSSGTEPWCQGKGDAGGNGWVIRCLGAGCVGRWVAARFALPAVARGAAGSAGRMRRRGGGCPPRAGGAGADRGWPGLCRALTARRGRGWKMPRVSWTHSPAAKARRRWGCFFFS